MLKFKFLPNGNIKACYYVKDLQSHCLILDK